MKARGRLVCLVCAIVALGLPAAAFAKPGYTVLSGGFELTIPLPKHDGASYSISASDHRHVELRVSRDGGSTTYKVEGRASSRGVHADFGPLGRIDLKIDPGEREPLPFPPLPGCKGKRPSIINGRFHGSVRFDGEGELKGFVAHRGPVSIEREFKTVCKQPHHHKHPHHSQPKRQDKKEKIEIDLLAAGSHAEGRKVIFFVLNFALPTNPSLSFAFVGAEDSERLGRVQVSRLAVEIADHVLAFSKPGSNPETATVKVSKPFLGSALYSAGPESTPTWSGDLRVPLPGAGVVPLTGPDFRADLCRAFSEAALERCLHESASQAEPLAATGFPSPLISFRNDFLSQILDTHPHAVKAFSGQFH